MSKTDKARLAASAPEIRKAETELADTTPEPNVIGNPRLIHLETVIERGLQTFINVESALLEIRDNKLYKPNYKTFQLYCRERWTMTVRRSYQLMDAAKVVENVNNCSQTPPTSESQVRPLTGLPQKAQRKVWKKAVQSANGMHPTARQVMAARERAKRNARNSPPPYEPKPDEQKALDAIEKRAKQLAKIITPKDTHVALKLDAIEKHRWLEIFAPIAAFHRSLSRWGI